MKVANRNYIHCVFYSLLFWLVIFEPSHSCLPDFGWVHFYGWRMALNWKKRLTGLISFLLVLNLLHFYGWACTGSIYIFLNQISLYLSIFLPKAKTSVFSLVLSQTVWLQQRDTSRIKGAAHNKIQCKEKEGKISKHQTRCTAETCFSICFSLFYQGKFMRCQSLLMLLMLEKQQAPWAERLQKNKNNQAREVVAPGQTH